MKKALSFFVIFVSACVSTWRAPDDFLYAPIYAGQYDIVTYQRISDTTSPIHIYIEGDGNAFDAYGHPTSDPTPRGTFLRDLATRDTYPNIVYMARPCQYIRSTSCQTSDWTDGRFSEQIINAMATAVRTVAQHRPIILIGYSGGAMVSGLIINKNPDLNVIQWVTIAGVLNHTDWTSYFGDSPLSLSLNLDTLPNVPQTHYIASGDRVVPNHLSQQWTGGNNLVVVSGATHTDFSNIAISFH